MVAAVLRLMNRTGCLTASLRDRWSCFLERCFAVVLALPLVIPGSFVRFLRLYLGSAGVHLHVGSRTNCGELEASVCPLHDEIISFVASIVFNGVIAVIMNASALPAGSLV